MTQAEFLRAHFDELHRQGFKDWDALEAELVRAWNSAHGIESVRIISAKALTDAEKKGFASRLPHSDIQYSINPELVAGVRIEWADRALDMSVAGMIQDLKKTL